MSAAGEAARPRIVSVGIAGVDLIARVGSFPAPDDKIRTEALSPMGGGNGGNTCTALARLGARCSLLSKVGDDAPGAEILRELRGDGVCVDNVVVEAGGQSPFTYVIVSAADKSRTCIHTPASEELLPEDLDEAALGALLAEADLLHLDSRHTAAAVAVAEAARAAGVWPIVLDVEKARPHLEELLPLCDVVITNSKYPHALTGEAEPEAALARMLEAHCPAAEVVISTRGADGCVAAVRRGARVDVGDVGDAGDAGDTSARAAWPAMAVSRSGVAAPAACVVTCGAYALEGRDIVDTTGAGDAFIAGVCFGLAEGYSLSRCLALGSRVAWHKLQGAGARTALPRASELADPDGSLLRGGGAR